MTSFDAARFEAAMARRLDPVSRAPLAVALSGGGDSMALLHLTLAWARERGRPVLALTVDHGLNPDSPRWTREAGERARAMGADWRALNWEGDKPTTGIQARARTARHALLAVAAREAGARVLLMGHTADDVAEGEVMRASDAPGLGRVREWGPSPSWPEGRGVMLLRPLLEVGRPDLRNYLTANGLAWLDDPANIDLRFARVRARTSLSSAHPRGGGDPVRTACAEAKTWVPASAGMSGVGLGDAVIFDEGRAAVSKAKVLGEANAKPALAALLLSVGGGTKPPRGPELDRLVEIIRAHGVSTLCGCRIDARADTLTIRLAPPRRGQPPRPAEPTAWIAARFRAACGLYPDEASLPAVDG